MKTTKEMLTMNGYNTAEVVVLKEGEKETRMSKAEFETVLDSIQIIAMFVKEQEFVCILDESKQIKIDSKTEVQNMNALLTKKVNKGLQIINIKFVSEDIIHNGRKAGIKLVNKIVVNKMSENKTIRLGLYNIEEKAVIKTGKSTQTIRAIDKYPFTYDLFKVDFRDCQHQKDLVLQYGIFTLHGPKETSHFLRHGDMLVNILAKTTNERGMTIPYSSVVNLIDGKEILKEGWKLHKVILATPSNERQLSAYAYDVTKGYDQAIDYMSIATHGGFSKARLGEKISYKGIAKEMPRWGQHMTASIDLGKIATYAIYFGKFNENKADGLAFENAKLLAAKFSNKTGRLITERALEGMFAQQRSGQSKVGSLYLSNNLFKELLLSLDKEPIFLSREEITLDIQKELDLAREGQGKFSGRVVCIGYKDIDSVESLFDLNGMKSSMDYSLPINTTILRILKSNSSNYSKTIHEKAVVKNADIADRIFKTLFREETIDIMTKTFINKETRVMSIDSINAESLYLNQVIESCSPTHLMQDRYFALSAIENKTKAVNRMINDFKMPMFGKNAGIATGIEVVFGIPSVIKYGEMFSHGIDRFVKNHNNPNIEISKDKVFVIKYPSMDINEYSVMKTVSLDEIKQRLNDDSLYAHLDSSVNIKNLKKLFINFYASLHDSVAIVDDSELFKNKHAGSDFDTDQISWSSFKPLVQVMEQDEYNNVAIVIEK